MSVVVLVADGARLDLLGGDLGDFPALARLRHEGGLYPVTSVFPSVTGPAYTPFLLGRFPGDIGLPGIRWYDRSRNATSWPDYSRSYVGPQLSCVDQDVSATSPTIFELVPGSIGALSVVTRGLADGNRYGTLTARSVLKVAATHFGGSAEGWLWMDREVLDTIPRRIREDHPEYVFAALVGIDKASHAHGHESVLVKEALGLVDATTQRIREDAERAGRWDDMHLWIVSDHGHTSIHHHEDLAGLVASTGARTISHPFTIAIEPDAAVMVSGNAMAHVYLDLGKRERPWWPALEGRWSPLADLLLERPATDLVLLPHSPGRCEVRSRRGNAFIDMAAGKYSYRRGTGDPLGAGGDITGTADETYDALLHTDYPDGIVQVAHLSAAARSGDIMLSASPGHDFRARYEPIPHQSAHGALHRDHMIVPLLTNRPPARTPRRTTDVFASTVNALGLRPPERMDGRSFV